MGTAEPPVQHQSPAASKPLSGKHRKFAEGIVKALSQGEAYRHAYPKCKTADAAASRLLKNVTVCAEIERLRAKADERAGPAVLTYQEKREFLARLVRARVAVLPEDSDLWTSIKRTKDGTEFKLPDKLTAIETDNSLTGDDAPKKFEIETPPPVITVILDAPPPAPERAAAIGQSDWPGMRT